MYLVLVRLANTEPRLQYKWISGHLVVISWEGWGDKKEWEVEFHLNLKNCIAFKTLKMTSRKYEKVITFIVFEKWITMVLYFLYI